MPTIFTLFCLALLFAITPTLLADQPPVTQNSISQYGITWTFEQPVQAGQFITGDWWVVGPVTVKSVTPEPGPIEEDKSQVQKSRYGAAGTQNDARMRNGSMIVEKASGKQGYDSRLRNYSPDQSVTYPVTVQPGQSLISSISGCLDGGKAPNLFHKRMWSSEKQSFAALRSAAVLTVLDKAPPADAFRPPYAGTKKPLYTFSQLQTDKLLNLQPAPDMPSFDEFERYLQRPWLDHTSGWLHQLTGPNENQVNYGREFARITGMAALMLNTDAPLDEKRDLLIGLVQLGIDLDGVIAAGRKYGADGGHYSGRKLPIVFAGVMLGDDRMSRPSAYSNFAEDMQTYYGTGWMGQPALFQMVVHTGPKPPYEHKPPTQWDKYDNRSEGYRIVNGTAWPATALAVRMMGLVNQWQHDAFFDYLDRWMSEQDPYAANRKALGGEKRSTRPKQEAGTFDPWTDAMWRMHRDNAPEPDWAGEHRQWIWQGREGKWIENAKPTEQQLKAHVEQLRTEN